MRDAMSHALPADGLAVKPDRASSTRPRRAVESTCRDAVQVLLDGTPAPLTPAAARALLEIVLGAAQSAPTVTPQRDNHPDGLEA
jgi:hypothetical protein